MDIKSINIRYSNGAKLAAVLIAWLGFLGMMGGCFFLYHNHDIASSSSYTEYNPFCSNFVTLVDNVVEYHVLLQSEDHIKSAEKNDQTTVGNLQRFRRFEDKLHALVNFVYWVRNTETGETWSNLKPETGNPVRFIQKQPTWAFLNGWTSDSSLPLYETIEDIRTVEDTMAGRPYEVYAAVAEPLQPGDMLYNNYKDYIRTKSQTDAAAVIAVLSFVLTVAAFVYLIYGAGRREPEGEVALSWTDTIYTDVYTVLVLIAAWLSLNVGFTASPGIPDAVTLMLLAVVLSLDLFIGLSYVLSMARQIKTGRVFTNTLLYQLGSRIKAFFRLAFQGKVFKKWTLLLLLGYGLVNGLLFMLYATLYPGYYPGYLNATASLIIVLIIALNAGMLYFAARSLVALPQIMVAVQEISAGHLDYPLDSARMPVSLAAFAENIRSLQGGLQKAVAEAVKGERMKTDLITNVSHDLKTPLTSIINYVDLLRQENLENETAAGYLTVLEEKSARLKQLIEDLVEASKASSGNLAVTGEKVDLQELIIQACGEYQEKIQQAELDLNIKTAGTAVIIWADGKHMWRIAENLLSNVVKYSLPHTRVYVDIGTDSDYGCFTVKNISSVPLNITPEQLTERFVRGDESRSTEGSGLGLSIAQSLTALQGGKFQLEIDGDLFKVTVAIPLSKED